MRGERIKITLKAGHHRPASETPFQWQFTGGPDGGPIFNASLVFQGIRTSIPKKPYIFVNFHGGGGGLDPLSKCCFNFTLLILCNDVKMSNDPLDGSMVNQSIKLQGNLRIHNIQ